MMAIVATAMGCATLGGVTRRFDEVNDGPSRIRSSERLPTQDRVEVSADDVGNSAAIHVRLSRVLVCQVLRTAPRVVTRTTTRAANRVLFGAEVTLAIVGVVITGAAVSSAAKACPSGNPDTCDISKASGWLAGVATAPFLVSTVTDLALTGGAQRSTRASTVDALQREYVEECGRFPAPNVHAKLTLPDGEVLEQTSNQAGAPSGGARRRRRSVEAWIFTDDLQHGRSTGSPWREIRGQPGRRWRVSVVDFHSSP